jgi:hypothetical protein
VPTSIMHSSLPRSRRPPPISLIHTFRSPPQ